MAYVKQTWNNGAAGSTPITAARLSHMEDGIENPVDSIPIGTYAEVPLGADKVIYVSPQGNDANDGRWVGADNAVRTIARAKTLLGAGPGTIKLGSGSYTIAAADANNNGLTLDYPGQVIESDSLQSAVVTISATGLTWGIKVAARNCRVSNLLAYITADTTYGVGTSCAADGSVQGSLFENVNCTFVESEGEAVFAIGPDNPGVGTMDIAQVEMRHCRAVCGNPGEVVNGFLIGNGTAGNVLQNNIIASQVHNTEYGITMDGSGITWTGGGMSGVTKADIRVIQGGGDIALFTGARFENGNQVITSTYGGSTFGGLTLVGCAAGNHAPTIDGTRIITWNNTSPLRLYGSTFQTAAATETVGVNTASGSPSRTFTAIDCTFSNANPYPAFNPAVVVRTIINASTAPLGVGTAPNGAFRFVVDKVPGRVDTMNESARSGAATLTASDLNTMQVCTVASAYTLTLPTPVGATGQQIGVRITPASTNLLTLATAAGNIDGAATRIMWAGESATLVSDGANWLKIGGKTVPMMASIKQAVIQSIPNNAVTVLGFDGSDVDNTGLMVTLGTTGAQTGHMTIKRPGTYSIQCQFGLAGLAGTAVRVIGQVNKNAAALASSEMYGAAGTFPCIPLSLPKPFVVGDAITASMYQVSGAAVDTAGGGAATPTLAVVEVPTW
jgi:hypothetical protein